MRIDVDKINTLTVTWSKEKVKVKIRVGDTGVKQVESLFIWEAPLLTKEVVRRRL